MESSTIEAFTLAAVWTRECSSNSNNNKLKGIIWCQTGFYTSWCSFTLNNYSAQEDRNKPEYIESKQTYKVLGSISSNPTYCGRMPGMTTQSQMSESFHHSILLFYQWHHYVTGRCALFSCRDVVSVLRSIPHADNNHKADSFICLLVSDSVLTHFFTQNSQLQTQSEFSCPTPAWSTF